jgi:phosphomannomutase
MMRHLAFAGLASAGCEVHDIGLVPTPTVGLMVRELGAVGGIAITASHNPSEWNAYKFFDHQGSFLSREQNRQLLEIAASGAFRRVTYDRLGRVNVRTDAIQRHLDRVFATIDTSAVAARRYKVVADCVNGIGGLILEPLFDRMGVRAELMYTDIHSPFPRNPEPLPENLAELGQRVRNVQADIGFAVDPDADRLAIVDARGRPLGEERTVALASVAALEAQPGPLVVNLSTTRAMDDVAARFGVVLHRTAIGEANVVGKIREMDARIGGEGNGGVIYPPVHCGRDAATGVALILAAMAAAKCTIAELNARIPDYVMVKTKFPLGDLDFAQLSARVREALSDATGWITEDGLKAVYPDAWLHVRPSGTEPVVRVFAEAPTAQAAHALVERANAAIGR